SSLTSSQPPTIPSSRANREEVSRASVLCRARFARAQKSGICAGDSRRRHRVLLVSWAYGDQALLTGERAAVEILGHPTRRPPHRGVTSGHERGGRDG